LKCKKIVEQLKINSNHQTEYRKTEYLNTYRNLNILLLFFVQEIELSRVNISTKYIQALNATGRLTKH